MKLTFFQPNTSPSIDDGSMEMTRATEFDVDECAATGTNRINANASDMRRSNMVSPWTYRIIVLLTVLFNGLISSVSLQAIAQDYMPWPEEIPCPTCYKWEGDRFDMTYIISLESGSTYLLRDYEIGVIVIDESNLESPREVKATYYESSNDFRVKVRGLFPDTYYDARPYIVYNGEKCVSENYSQAETSQLFRDQNSGWNDYTHTQTTITIKRVQEEGFRLEINEDGYYIEIPTEGYTIENLEPRPWFVDDNEGLNKTFRLYKGDKYKDYKSTLYTARIKLDIDCKTSPTGLLLKPSCVNKDADIQGFKLVSPIEERIITDDCEEVWYGGLNPNAAYNFSLYAIIKSKSTGNEYLYPMRKFVNLGVYNDYMTFKTTELIFGDVNVTGVSPSSSIASVTTNIDAKETGIGFQWKKYDAPPTLKPSEGYAAIYDGRIEGKIRNLQSQYYNIRPIYTNKSGNYYYGDWITFDPTDFSYIDPVVHTGEAISITDNSACLNGYVLEGSDDILEQGFEYESSSDSVESCKIKAPLKSSKAIGTGQIMTVTIGNLKPGTTYTFRAYALTSKGEIYGDDLSFATDDSAGISENVFKNEPPSITGYYSLSGYKFDTPQRGLNIVIYSDGTTKKIIVR